MNQGFDTALKENEARLRELAGRTEKLRSEKEAVSTEIDKLKEDIAKQQVRIFSRFICVSFLLLKTRNYS